MKIILDAPKCDGISHRRFDEVGQGFTGMEHGLKLGAQGWFDADFRNDLGFHRASVLRLSQVFNGRLRNRARQTSLRRRRHHEGVQDLRTGAREVGRIARHDGQIVKKRGGRNLLVQGVLGVRDS